VNFDEKCDSEDDNYIFKDNDTVAEDSNNGMLLNLNMTIIAPKIGYRLPLNEF
jgi:hypothetical protein